MKKLAIAVFTFAYSMFIFWIGGIDFSVDSETFKACVMTAILFAVFSIHLTQLND